MANKVILSGNVGEDPKINTANNTKVASFSLATTERYTQNNEKKVVTDWHRIVMWRQLAELCEKYVKKGTKLYIEGKLKTRSYEKEGQTHYVTEIVADHMEFLGAPKSEATQTQPSQIPTDEEGDDLPF
jgi:single-strand DNA-binding protein